jgi:hypothetical protein
MTERRKRSNHVLERIWDLLKSALLRGQVYLLAGPGSQRLAAYRPRVLQLLVVPPEWDDRRARHAMRIAAMPSNVKSAATILSELEDQHRAGLLSHWDDDGGTNPTL